MRLGSGQRTNGLSHMHAGMNPDRESLYPGPGTINSFLLLNKASSNPPLKGTPSQVFGKFLGRYGMG